VPEPNYAIELTPPDIEPYRAGNTGVEYVTTFDSGTAGPHVLVTALTHGNEICGAIALDHLLRAGVRPVKGKLTFIFANVAAYQSFNRHDPSAARYLDEDMNRVWDKSVLDGLRTSTELRRARALRPVIDTADVLLDIHSMTNASMPLVLTGMEQKHLAFARRVGVPALLVRDTGHASGRRMRDYARFADPTTPPIALLVECGHHWARGTVDVAIETAWRFLAASGVLSEHEAARHLGPEAPTQQTVLVTHRITADSDDFRFSADYSGLEVIPRAGTVIARDGHKTIETPYDDCVLVMPTRRFVRGQTAVRLGHFED
jgi:predicted deacylase